MWCVPLSRSERQLRVSYGWGLIQSEGKDFPPPILVTYFSIYFPQAKHNPFQNKKRTSLRPKKSKYFYIAASLKIKLCLRLHLKSRSYRQTCLKNLHKIASQMGHKLYISITLNTEKIFYMFKQSNFPKCVFKNITDTTFLTTCVFSNWNNTETIFSPLKTRTPNMIPGWLLMWNCGENMCCSKDPVLCKVSETWMIKRVILWKVRLA